MRRGLKPRLDRRMARRNRAENSDRDRRCSWRLLAASGAAIRYWLAQMGIDPERAVMLRVADEAAAALAAIPDTDDLRSADGQGRSDEPAREDLGLDPETARLVERYRGGEPDPDLSQASLCQLFAWCIARNIAGEPVTSSTEDRDVCC